MINVIAGSFSGGGTTNSARKKYLQEVLSLTSEKMKKTQRLFSTPEVIFLSSNLEGIVPRHDDPMVILATMVNAEVKRVIG